MITRRLTSAFIIALVISGVFTFWLSQRFKSKPAPPPPKSQYVALTANLEAGQQIKAENLRMVDWPATVPLPGAFNAPQPVIGRIVLYPLAAGEPILERQLANPGSSAGLSMKIPDGMRAISLRSDEVVGVAGFLLPGTHVDVLVTVHPQMLDVASMSQFLLMAADHPWKDKPVTDWNDGDTKLILPDSPWAKAVKPAVEQANATGIA